MRNQHLAHMFHIWHEFYSRMSLTVTTLQNEMYWVHFNLFYLFSEAVIAIDQTKGSYWHLHCRHSLTIRFYILYLVHFPWHWYKQCYFVLHKAWEYSLFNNIFSQSRSMTERRENGDREEPGWMGEGSESMTRELE